MMKHWQNILEDVWGIKGHLTRLDGEYDLNFLVSGDKDYVLKVMRAGCNSEFVRMQCQAIKHVCSRVPDIPVPGIVPALSGELLANAIDEEGRERIVWLIDKVDGHTYAKFRPHTTDLANQLGSTLAQMNKALDDFEHNLLDREFKWNLLGGDWVAEHTQIITNPDRRDLLDGIVQEFGQIKSALIDLPTTAIHNDVNDYNILVHGSLSERPHVTGVIDFGDMCSAPRVCELAIAGAYLVLDHDHPESMLTAMVAAYHAEYPLTPVEVDLIWPLLQVRLAVSLVNSTQMAIENPDDPYVVISQAPAWHFLETHSVNEAQIGARLRVACGLEIVENAERVMDWLRTERGNFASVLGRGLDDIPLGSFAVEDSTVPTNPFQMDAREAESIGVTFGEDNPIWIGYYGEPRLIYTEEAFRLGPWKASDRRTVHIGTDIFGPAGTLVFAPLGGVVEFAGYREANLDYGGLVMLAHKTPAGDTFYTLYGHLSKASADNLTIGQRIEKGEKFATFGGVEQNGGWTPHVHVQLALSTHGMLEDWPGAVSPDDLDFWMNICPNPAALLNLPDETIQFRPLNRQEVLKSRKQHFGDNLKLSYSQPVMLLRGWQHHLFDEWGRPYLDAYNNVPHVGHAHPRIQAVAADQLKRMNSNTRYLHPAQTAFAEKLLSKMPEGLSVCFFVNSGTEANELSLRLARAHTSGKDMVTPDHGYHGNTTGAIDISAYKFNAKGGVGPSDWVHLIEVADDYRGRYRRDDPNRAEKYASQVDRALDDVNKRGGKLAGFIAETFPSVGGQIIPPEGYLQEVYQRIRAAGGICVADEVQTGLGRLGDYYFGFEQQKVVPDIVVLGKPIGNGHPLGVVVTTLEIADSFAKGPEYFSTFGGSNLSCRTGKEVLDIVDEEGLMENARVMGNKLLDGLRDLQSDFDIIGDVRGYGLFIGLDLVENFEKRIPGTEIADYVKNRMRDYRILIGTEGPADNILKIRPPLTIDVDGVSMILHVMRKVLLEVSILIGSPHT